MVFPCPRIVVETHGRLSTAQPRLVAPAAQGAAGNIDAMSPSDENSDTGVVPLFGTWRAAYSAVIVVIVLMIAFVFAFSRYPY
jgi:hypothetical protein